MSDDWVPLHDTSPLRGFYLAIATSGNQFKNAPAVGDIMLSIIQTKLGGVGHDRNPTQLQLTEIGRTVVLAVYTRLRQAHATRSAPR